MNFRVPTIVLTLGLASLVPSTLANAQQTVIPLWPHATPEPAQTIEPEAGVVQPANAPINRRRTASLTNVTAPTLSVYPPRDHSIGAAALVFPGGNYQRITWGGEDLDACRWLNSLGVTCLLVKYRVPEQGSYPSNPSDLEDAQQAMRLARAHAAEWHIDPTHIGVMGFSAGANLAVLLSNHPDDHHVESTPAAPDVDTHISARADFAILVSPAFLAVPPQQAALDPAYIPNQFTPATFLIQAENDRRFGKNALVYYSALVDAGVPAELHYFATGGHGFGMQPVNAPEQHWSILAATWLHSINVLPSLSDNASDFYTPGGSPCPIPQAPTPGSPANTSSINNPPTPVDPNCPQIMSAPH